MGGPPILVYLMALTQRTTVVRASSIVYFMAASSLSLLLMLWRGLIDGEVLTWSIASVPVLIAGTYGGNWGFRHSAAHHHRMVALLTLSVLDVLLITRGLGAW